MFVCGLYIKSAFEVEDQPITTVHGAGLVVGTLLVTVLFLMEITKGEHGNPSPSVVANTVDKEGR